MRLAVVAVLLGLVLAAPATAPAATPSTGWWRGVNADGVRVSFAVVDTRGGRAVSAIVLGCDDFGRAYSGLSTGSTDVVFRDRNGDEPTGAPNAHAAYPLRRSGALDTRVRSLRPPPGSAWFESEFSAAPPFRARLGGRSGRVTLRDPGWSTNACAKHPPAAGDVIEVARVASPVRPGVWRVKGLLPFGDVFDYAAAKFYVQPSGVAGSFKGVFIGPSIPPRSAPRPDPLFSPWPAPCFDQNVTPDMGYDFDETFLVQHTPIAEVVRNVIEADLVLIDLWFLEPR